MTASHRLLELIPAGAGLARSEVTLYVKGFLGRQERPDDFAAWTRQHRSLVARLGWGPAAYGWTWESGSMAGIPLPVFSGLKVGWDVYRLLRGVGRSNVLGASAFFLAEQGTRLALRFVRQYLAAASAAQAHAAHLSAELDGLAQRYERIRIVAHSLGCVQVIEAVAGMPPEARPHELHLCAPACLENDVATKLEGSAQEQSYLYFTPHDLVLESAFRIMARGRALGSTGPQSSYQGLIAVDVSEHFEFFVHTEYKNRLERFVR